jgi:flavin reductase (DIM6/NTAB) family NADH-FMN oxidoreductase RutF
MCRTVKPPHVAEAAFSMECELVHKYEVRQDSGALSNTVVFGRVKRFHCVSRACDRSDAQKEFIFDKSDPMRILPEKLQAVSRLGGVT